MSRLRFIFFIGALGILLLFPALLKIPVILSFYVAHGYAQLQSVRSWFWQFTPVSIGDIWYVILGMTILFAIVMWTKQLISGRLERRKAISRVKYALGLIAILYCMFEVGWGVNYARGPVGDLWQLNTQMDSNALFQYDSFLVSALNRLSSSYYDRDNRVISDACTSYYLEQTNCNVARNALMVKPSLFGQYMQYLGIEGYYNPFTGEGQIDAMLPKPLIPFVTAHEMAHQAGIAAEDDANLVAYAVCTRCNDPMFQYSAYLNVWMYVNNRARWINKPRAKLLEQQFNAVTLGHLVQIREKQRLFHKVLGGYSNSVYDSYLKMQAQKDGMDTYAHIVKEGWALELLKDRHLNQFKFRLF